MRKLLALLLAAVLPVAGLAYYAGIEIVPHSFASATYGIPYVIVGYNSGPGFAHIGLSNPLTINGWYMAKAGGFYAITQSLRISGHFAVWGEIQNFAFTGGAWTVGTGVDYTLDRSLAVFLDFNIPPAVPPGAPFWGMWITVGFRFYFGLPSTAPEKAGS